MFSTSKKMIVAGILTLSVLGAGATAALAEEEMPSADATIGLYSKYVWRGYELSDDTLVIQPSLSVSYKGFGANLWANLNANDDVALGPQYDSNLWTETDYTLSYDGSYEKLGYGVGWIYYSILGTDTQEFYATVSYDTILSPSLTIYYDTDALAGDWYANLSIGHSFALSETISLDLGLAVGYYSIDGANTYNGVDYDEFHDGVLSAAVSIPVGKYVTITPEVYWSFALTDDAEDFYEVWNYTNPTGMPGSNWDDNHFYGGVAASFSF